VPSDYRAGLVPLAIKNLGYQIDWVAPHRADLVVYGSFYDLNASRLRWLPKSWRQGATAAVDAMEKQLAKRRIPPLTLFHTGENLRHDHIKADYSISHDLNISSHAHFRLPYWMEMVDWSHEGLMGNINPRYGQLLNLERLQSPLGNQFLTREQKGILLSSHLREPRASALSALQKLIPVDGFGPYFDKKIKDHHSRNFLKKNILANYAYNLCPENGLYPGYVTEKIPEAFTASCLPITYVDKSVEVDFNPKAFINLALMAESTYDELKEILQSKTCIEAYASQPLITQRPSLEQLRSLLKNIVSNAL
jgi:hypothetical protein